MSATIILKHSFAIEIKQRKVFAQKDKILSRLFVLKAILNHKTKYTSVRKRQGDSFFYYDKKSLTHIISKFNKIYTLSEKSRFLIPPVIMRCISYNLFFPEVSHSMTRKTISLEIMSFNSR